MKTAEEVRTASLTKNDWTIEQVEELQLIFSPLLRSVSGLVHAFSTRNGGKSEPPLQHFNLGRHWQTDSARQDALDNRQRLCSVLRVDIERLVVPSQIHSSRVGWASEPASFPEHDAVATVTRNMPILLHYADCTPIILVDMRKKAVCVIHAGWRGTAGGIATRAVETLISVLESDPADMVAAVGPAIGSCCYPTGEDVAEKLLGTVKQSDGLIEVRNGKPHPDLKAISARQLLEAGVGQVDVTSWCTACHPELFYSHRQSGGKTGRQGALAAII